MSQGAPDKAARAISRLARAHVANQNAVARAGGVPLLVGLLEESEAANRALRRQEGTADHPNALEAVDAESFLSSCASELGSLGQEEPIDATGGATPWLRADLEHRRRAATPPAGERRVVIGSAQKEIAGAIWSMSVDNPVNQVSVAEAGGIPPLVEMLRVHPAGFRDAAGALWALGADVDNRQAIAECDAEAHSHTSVCILPCDAASNAHSWTRVLRVWCSCDGIRPLVAVLRARGPMAIEAHETAAGAIGILAQTPSNRSLIANAGGIGPLVETFNFGSPETRQQASSALLTLALQNEANQLTIAAGLVRILTHGAPDAQEQACDLTRKLSIDPENRGALAKVQSIPQLVRQLQTGTEASHAHAAEALSNIALKSAELRVQVSK